MFILFYMKDNECTSISHSSQICDITGGFVYFSIVWGNVLLIQ